MSTRSLTLHQRQYWAWLLKRRAASDSVESLASTLVDAQVDLNPHQVEAALFACQNPLSKGVILADEVGLGKTIEAGLVISQRWAERRRRILIIVPANLRKQWHQELLDKFGIEPLMLESKSYNAARKQGTQNPFQAETPVICSYPFARTKADDIRRLPWDLVVLDEAHRVRNVYKPSNVIGRTLRDALEHVDSKVLLTATPSQRSLMVVCSAWRGVTAAAGCERWPQLTLKKIPKAVLSRCEWGHDDSSLNVANLPMAREATPVSDMPGHLPTAGRRQPPNQAPLFDEESS